MHSPWKQHTQNKRSIQSSVKSQTTTSGSVQLKHILIKTTNPDCWLQPSWWSPECGWQPGPCCESESTASTAGATGLISLMGWPQSSEKPCLDAEPLITACMCHSHTEIKTGPQHSTEYWTLRGQLISTRGVPAISSHYILITSRSLQFLWIILMCSWSCSFSPCDTGLLEDDHKLSITDVLPKINLLKPLRFYILTL